MVKPRRMTLIARCNIEVEHTLEVVSGLWLAATVVRRGTYEPITHKNIGFVAGTACNVRESFRQGLRRAVITDVESVAPHGPQSAQLRDDVIQAFGGFECLGQHRPGPFHEARRVKQRISKCDMQLHSEARAQVQIGLKTV
jgi:hypothetical protein